MTHRETTIEGGHARRIFLVANGSHGRSGHDSCRISVLGSLIHFGKT